MKIPMLVLSSLALLSASDVGPMRPKLHPLKQLATRVHQAAKLAREYPNFRDVQAVVKVASALEKTCLPGVLKVEDYLSIAFVESRFNLKALGAAGERGVFQVLDWKVRLKSVRGYDPYNVEVNGAMACMELREKYLVHRSYKKTLQAYNNNNFKRNKYSYYHKVQKFRQLLASSGK